MDAALSPSVESCGSVEQRRGEAAAQSSHGAYGGHGGGQAATGHGEGHSIRVVEDELGMVDLVVKPDVFEQYRPLLHHQTFILVEGVVQRANEVVSVLVSRALSFAPFLNVKGLHS